MCNTYKFQMSILWKFAHQFFRKRSKRFRFSPVIYESISGHALTKRVRWIFEERPTHRLFFRQFDTKSPLYIVRSTFDSSFIYKACRSCQNRWSPFPSQTTMTWLLVKITKCARFKVNAYYVFEIFAIKYYVDIARCWWK